jgi:DNA-binding NarL/FixJ family response regulator
MDDSKETRRIPTTGDTAILENGRGRKMRAVEELGSERPEFFRIDCPYPLVVAGLAQMLEGTQLRHRQGPLELDESCVVLLWVEDQTTLHEGMERIQKTRPDSPVVVLGLREDPPLALAALKAGARGFVHAGMDPEQVARAISVAAKGEIVAPRWLLGHLVAEVSSDEPPELSSLSLRQREILKLVDEGLSNVEIARRLYLTESTIKQHLRSAYKQLKVKNRVEATKLIRRANGL